MNSLVILLISVQLVATYANSFPEKRDTLNAYDLAFKFSCPDGKAASSISSVHSNSAEDRQWSMHCDKTLPTNRGGKQWTFYENDMEGEQDFHCADGNIIVGFGSIHDNGPEDRRYQFECQLFIGQTRNICKYSPASSYDAPLQVTIPSGYYWTGMKSHHYNRAEDRQFEFEFCSFHGGY